MFAIVAPEIDRVLQQMIKEYGTSLLDDPRRCEALLLDLAADNQKQIFLLITSLKYGVPSALQLAGPSEIRSPEFRSMMILGLSDDRGLSEAASSWAIRCWANALGISDWPVTQKESAPKKRTAARKKAAARLDVAADRRRRITIAVYKGWKPSAATFDRVLRWLLVCYVLGATVAACVWAFVSPSAWTQIFEILPGPYGDSWLTSVVWSPYWPVWVGMALSGAAMEEIIAVWVTRRRLYSSLNGIDFREYPTLDTHSWAWEPRFRLWLCNETGRIHKCGDPPVAYDGALHRVTAIAHAEGSGDELTQVHGSEFRGSGVTCVTLSFLIAFWCVIWLMIALSTGYFGSWRGHVFHLVMTTLLILLLVIALSAQRRWIRLITLVGTPIFLAWWFTYWP